MMYIVGARSGLVTPLARVTSDTVERQAGRALHRHPEAAVLLLYSALLVLLALLAHFTLLMSL